VSSIWAQTYVSACKKNLIKFYFEVNQFSFYYIIARVFL
jgi:hypothetical protein